MSKDFKDHFSDRAAGYASYRPHYPPELAEWLASVAPSREHAWDAGCGSGQLSTLLGDHFAKVIATDASSAQIERAVPHASVEYRVEPAEGTTIAGGSIDLVTVAQAAHWLDLEGFYDEVHRVARPSGIIALVAYERTHIEPAIDAIIERFYSNDLAGYWPAERRHIESGYQLLSFPFQEIEAPHFEMRAEWTAGELAGYIRTWSAVRAMESAKGPAETDRFAEEIRHAWGDGKRPVVWPLVVRTGRIDPAT